MVGTAMVVGAWLCAAPIESVPIVSLVPDFDHLLAEPLAIAPQPENHVARWTLIGSASGAAVGIGLGFLNLNGKSALASDHRDVFVGGAVGALTGALVGYLLAPKPPAPTPPPPPVVELVPHQEKEQSPFLPTPLPSASKPPKPYESGWLVASVVGSLAATVPIAASTQVSCPNHPETKPSPAVAVVIPVFWAGLAALLGNSAANDHDAAKVGVVVVDVLGPVIGLASLWASAARCNY
jgi:hypothetical protein